MILRKLQTKVFRLFQTLPGGNEGNFTKDTKNGVQESKIKSGGSAHVGDENKNENEFIIENEHGTIIIKIIINNHNCSCNRA